MSEQFLGRCSLCRGNIYYTEAEAFVICPSCGETQAVALFQREKIKLQQIKQQKEQAQADLIAAQQEKQIAQEKLNKAITALADADFSKKQLEKIAAQLGEDRRAFEQLMAGLQNGQSALLQTLRGSDGMQKKLQDLQDKVQFVLDMGLGNTRQLEDVCASAAALLSGQRRFDGKIDRLQTTADEMQKKLDALQTAWKQDKLDRVEELYRQAENARSEFRFEKAAEKYEELQLQGSKYAKDPEIFWRMLLSHYGVKYQHSDAADGYVPTIFYPDLTDPAQMSLRRELFACCNAQQEKHYRQALDKIDKVLNRYRELRDGTHYDVFISVKQKDGDHYTADYDKGIELYNQLKSWGLKVFNSERVTIPAGQDFEPHIIAALASAKVMIVVGTNPEYMNSDWVRNEWTRFQWLQKEEAQHGKNDRVLFCYLANGMQPGQLPKGLDPNRQAIIEGVGSDKKLRDTLKASFPQIAAPVTQIETVAEDPLKQMRIWLMMGQYQLVQDKYNELVKKGQYLDNIYAHLDALCAAHKVANIDALIESDVDLSKEKLFTVAMNVNRAEQPKLQQMLQRNEQWRKERQEAEKQRKAEEERARKAAAEKQRLEEEERARKLAESVYEYTVKTDNTVAITKYKGRDTKLVIPSQLDGRKVTRIGGGAFKECRFLTSVKIPVGVTSIGYSAFASCISLTSVELPNGLANIEDFAFAFCYGLAGIVLPDKLTCIRSHVFCVCKNLTSIKLPDSVTSIGDHAFSDCSKLKSISLSNSLTRIEKYAFSGCDSLTSVDLPAGVINIGEHAFLNCSKLTLRVQSNSNAHTYAKGNNLKYELIPGAMTRQEMQKTTKSVYEKQTVVKEQVEKEEKTSVGKYIVSIFGGLLMWMGMVWLGICIEEIGKTDYYGTSVNVPAAMIMTVCALSVGWILCRRVKIVKRIAGALWMLFGAFAFVVFAYYGFKHGFFLDKLWAFIYSVAIILVGWLMFRRGKK